LLICANSAGGLLKGINKAVYSYLTTNLKIRQGKQDEYGTMKQLIINF
jgi:hypothetical protein